MAGSFSPSAFRKASGGVSGFNACQMQKIALAKNYLNMSTYLSRKINRKAFSFLLKFLVYLIFG